MDLFKGWRRGFPDGTWELGAVDLSASRSTLAALAAARVAAAVTWPGDTAAAAKGVFIIPPVDLRANFFFLSTDPPGPEPRCDGEVSGLPLAISSRASAATYTRLVL